MRRFTVFSLILFFFFSVLAYLWLSETGAATEVAQLKQRFPFSEDEMTFQSSGKTLFGDGVVLYHPTFPNLPLKIKADKITLRYFPREIKIRLSGMTIDVAKTLSNRGADYLLNSFRELKMPDGLICQPLEIMALVKRDVLVGTADLTLDQKGDETVLIAEISAKNGEKIQLRAPISNISERGLWGWTTGSIQTASLTVTGKSFPLALAGYYRATATTLPESVRKAIETGENYHTLIHLTKPLKLADIFLIR